VEVKVKNQEIMRLKSETCIESFDLTRGARNLMKSIGYYEISDVDYLDKNLKKLHAESINFDRITLTVEGCKLWFDTTKYTWIFSNPKLDQSEKKKALDAINCTENMLENMDYFVQLMKNSPNLLDIFGKIRTTV
jgi:hypothetical protein